MKDQDRERNKYIKELNYILSNLICDAIYENSFLAGFWHSSEYYKQVGRNSVIEKLIETGMTKKRLSKILDIPVDELLLTVKDDFSSQKVFNHGISGDMIEKYIQTSIEKNAYIKGKNKGLTKGFDLGFNSIVNELIKSGMSKEEVSQRLHINLG